jgi:hypothetical protein
MYAVYHGPTGLTAMARRVHGLATLLERELSLVGVRQLNPAYFDTLRLKVANVDALRDAALAAGMNFRYRGGGEVNVALDETTDLDDVQAIVTAFASAQANGSLIVKDGRPVGSTLIGQPFDDPKYFWSRLSATSPAAYNGGASSGSNLGPLSDALTDAVKGRIDALKAADPGNTLPVPVDLVTASGSGLDPHISPAAARFPPRDRPARRKLSFSGRLRTTPSRFIFATGRSSRVTIRRSRAMARC